MLLLIAQYLSKCGMLARNAPLHISLLLITHEYILCIDYSGNFLALKKD